MGSGSNRQIEVIARGVLIRQGRVLLCRNVSVGYHYLPGGHVEFGEPAATALAREFVEEADLHIRVGRCALVSENLFRVGGRTHHEINLVFHVEQHSNDPDALERAQSRESDIAFDWADLASVVDLDIRPAAAKAWLLSADRARANDGPEWVSETSDAAPESGSTHNA